MPKAYMMVHLEATNQQAFVTCFATKVEAVVKEFGGKFIARAGNSVHRHENQFNGSVADVHGIVEFPDSKSAIAWYDSEQYKAILPARRDNTTNTYLAIIDGVED